jgi:hypothetical protein
LMSIPPTIRMKPDRLELNEAAQTILHTFLSTFSAPSRTCSGERFVPYLPASRSCAAALLVSESGPGPGTKIVLR